MGRKLMLLNPKGIDSKGRIRYKNSKKNPIITHGILWRINGKSNGTFITKMDDNDTIGHIEKTNPKTGEVWIKLN